MNKTVQEQFGAVQGTKCDNCKHLYYLADKPRCNIAFLYGFINITDTSQGCVLNNYFRERLIRFGTKKKRK